MASLIAVTLPQHERKVERALKRRGLQCYLPRMRSHTRRTVLMMPSYVFAGPPEAWAEVARIAGVRRLLAAGNSSQPAVLQDHELAPIRRYEQDALAEPKAKRLRRGQRVRIVLGALSGLVGTYQGGDAKRERVALALGEVSLPQGNLALEQT